MFYQNKYLIIDFMKDSSVIKERFTNKTENDVNDLFKSLYSGLAFRDLTLRDQYSSSPSLELNEKIFEICELRCGNDVSK
jgi:hypothetical protein